MHPLDGWVMVICNPVSGSGKGLALLSVLRRKLDDADVRYASEVTQRRGDAARLAHGAVVSGCSSIIAIGGDGTLFEVVNGMMSQNEPGVPFGFGNDVAVGLVQAGRGSDFGRSIGIPTDPQAACERILQGRTVTIDLGFVSYSSFRGEKRARYFANAAGMGFDAEVTVRANSGPKGLGGTIPYLSSLFMTLGTYRNKHVEVKVDGEAWRAQVNSIIVANGQYFGGGMKIAPEAQLSDGEFDVVVLGDLGKIDLVRNVPRVYDGSHVAHPKVRVMSGKTIEVESPDHLLLQADGEVLGTAPATFTLVPSALRVIV
jgi:YegS/Rv2252/BmrU family lipid kinase